MTETLVKVESISKKFCRGLKRSLWYGMQDLGNELRGRAYGGELRRDEFWAVNDVSFELKRGECLGLIGRNGAGKTTLLRMLNGLIKPDKGRIEMRGRVGALIALGAGFNPLLTGRENIYINASVLGFRKHETDSRFDEIVEFSGLAVHLDSPVQHYSSGMYARLGFAIAAHLEPHILLVDEALAVGDLAFVVKCLNRIGELRRNGTGVVFVSHNELQVREVAQECLLMHQGCSITKSSPDRAFLDYDRLCTESEGVENPDVGFVHDGPIKIMDLNIRSADGQSSGRTGDRLVLDLRFSAAAEFIDATFVLRFWNGKGQLLTTIRSGSYGLSFNIKPGVHNIHIVISPLTLPPGQYRVAGNFMRDGEVLGWSRDITYMDVRPPVEGWLGQGLVMMPMQIELAAK